MRRFHVHLSVQDLPASIRFYSRLFAAEPTVQKDDYAKWLLDDPQLNFAISQRCGAPGLSHLGFQVDDAEGLAELGRRLDAADAAILPEANATCCYARSDKLWSEDPQGIRWESFHSFGEATSYYGAAGPTLPESDPRLATRPARIEAAPAQAQAGSCGCSPA